MMHKKNSIIWVANTKGSHLANTARYFTSGIKLLKIGHLVVALINVRKWNSIGKTHALAVNSLMKSQAHGTVWQSLGLEPHTHTQWEYLKNCFFLFVC